MGYNGSITWYLYIWSISGDYMCCYGINIYGLLSTLKIALLFLQHANTFKQGYPFGFFITMFFIGIIIWFSLVLSMSVTLNTPQTFLSNCKYNDKFEMIQYPITNGRYPSSFGKYWYLYTALSFTLWDLITLGAYLWKIRSFTNKNKHEIVHKRIRSILYKITILTLFYQTWIFAANVIAFSIRNRLNQVMSGISDTLSFCVQIFSMTISMYLMMDHNKVKYVKFLRFMHYFRIHYICYCCKHSS